MWIHDWAGLAWHALVSREAVYQWMIAGSKTGGRLPRTAREDVSEQRSLVTKVET